MAAHLVVQVGVERDIVPGGDHLGPAALLEVHPILRRRIRGEFLTALDDIVLKKCIIQSSIYYPVFDLFPVIIISSKNYCFGSVIPPIQEDFLTSEFLLYILTAPYTFFTFSPSPQTDLRKTTCRQQGNKEIF